MSDAFSPRRRGFLGMLGILPILLASVRMPHAQQVDPSDRGIGGTGARPPEDEQPGGDRGIGGTGVIGTIRRFGSIIVNDLRISYPRDVAVRIDGAPARVSDLKIGHVVRVVAQGEYGALSTRHIEVTSEVVGPVEAMAKGRMTVLGQSVRTSAAQGATTFAIGDRVAVSGLRRGDGSIVASLIEARPDGPARVAGPVKTGNDGMPAIGGLRLDGLTKNLVGRRAAVEGQAGGTGLAVSSARDVSRPFPAGLGRASIEGYVVGEGETLRLGSGLRLANTAGIAVAAGSRAVLNTGVAADGRLTVDSVRVGGRGGPGGPGGQGPGGPGGMGPGGPDPRGGGPGGGGFGPGGRGGGPSGAGPGGNGGYRIDTRPMPGGGSPGGGFGGGHGGQGFGGGGGPGGAGPGFGGPGGPGGPGFGGGGGGGGGFGGGGGGPGGGGPGGR